MCLEALQAGVRRLNTRCPGDVSIPDLSWVHLLNKEHADVGDEAWVIKRLVTWSAIMFYRGCHLSAVGQRASAFWSLWRSYDIMLHCLGIEAQALRYERSGRFVWARRSGGDDVTSHGIEKELGLTSRDRQRFRRARNELVLGHGFRGASQNCLQQAQQIAKQVVLGHRHHALWQKIVRDLEWAPRFADFLQAAFHWGMRRMISF